ncbi:MAG: hypothetical protein J6X18_07935 [Bacteroidales bacterium]|nr:hypothetical protein [Bacteroidales bacterium]
MEKNELNNTTIIKNVSTDRSEILHNIMELYNDGEPFDCDMTASTLAFYRKKKNEAYEIPAPKILFDVYPQTDDTIKITPFEKLPLEDGSIHSIVVDLPFLVFPPKCPSVGNENSNKMFNRFTGWYPATEFYENAYWWLKECHRVLSEGGICVWKMQNTVSGGQQRWFTYYSFMAALANGFLMEDEFVLRAKNRMISAGKYKKQVHARKYTSNFMVFKKDTKKAPKQNTLEFLKQAEENVGKLNVKL